MKKEITELIPAELNDRKIKYFNSFKSNLLSGIAYYKMVLPKLVDNSNWKSELEIYFEKVSSIETPMLVSAN